MTNAPYWLAAHAKKANPIKHFGPRSVAQGVTVKSP